MLKSIVCDNGCKNLNSEGIERLVFTKQRYIIIYAHPNSAYERGVNEVADGLIRHFAP